MVSLHQWKAWYKPQRHTGRAVASQLHAGLGSKAVQRIHELWRTKYGRRYAHVIGKAAVAAYQDSARKRASKTSKLWSGLAESIKYRVSKVQAKGVREIVVTVNHDAAMLKEYGGFIREHGPYSKPSVFHGHKSDFIPIRLASSPFPKPLGQMKRYLFRERGLPSYDRHYLQSAPLLRFAAGSGDKGKATGGMWKVSERERQKWLKTAKTRGSIRGAIKRKAMGKTITVRTRRGGTFTREIPEDRVEMMWYEEQEALERGGIQSTVGVEGKDRRKAFSQSISKILSGDSGNTSKKPWQHPKYGDLSVPPDPTSKVFSDRSKWGGSSKGMRFLSVFSGMLSKKVRKKYGARKLEQFQRMFLATSRLVFIRNSRKSITPVALLVKSIFIPPQRWIPTLEQVNRKVKAALRTK